MKKQQFNYYKEKGYNNIPIYQELIADTDTALGIYLKLANNKYSYLFESVEGGEKWGRYSIIGMQSDEVIKVFGYDIFHTTKGKQQKITVENPLDWIDNYQKHFKTPILENLILVVVWLVILAMKLFVILKKN